MTSQANLQNIRDFITISNFNATKNLIENIKVIKATMGIIGENDFEELLIATEELLSFFEHIQEMTK
jgi:hypothetical protein